MQQSDAYLRMVSVLRVAYLFVVAAIVAIIYAAPDKPASAADDVLYYAFLAVAFSELIVMKVFDAVAARSASAVEGGPKPSALPIVYFALGISTAIYGLVYRLIGGSVIRSLSFLAFTFVAYIIFSLATVRYAPSSRGSGSN